MSTVLGVFQLQRIGQGTQYNLRNGVTKLGRHHDCEIQVASPLSSRNHCEIQIAGDTITISDGQSTNGTFINKQQMTVPQQRLAIGDVIGIGIGIVDPEMLRNSSHAVFQLKRFADTECDAICLDTDSDSSSIEEIIVSTDKSPPPQCEHRHNRFTAAATEKHVRPPAIEPGHSSDPVVQNSSNEENVVCKAPPIYIEPPRRKSAYIQRPPQMERGDLFEPVAQDSSNVKAPPIKLRRQTVYVEKAVVKTATTRIQLRRQSMLNRRPQAMYPTAQDSVPAKVRHTPKVKMTLNNRGAFLADMASLPPTPAELRRRIAAEQNAAAAAIVKPVTSPMPMVPRNIRPQQLNWPDGDNMPFDMQVVAAAATPSRRSSQSGVHNGALAIGPNVDDSMCLPMCRNNREVRDPNDDIRMHDVTGWNTDWLEQATDAPPPDVNGNGDVLVTMHSNYVSLSEYLKSVLKNMNIDMWHRVHNAYRSCVMVRHPTPSMLDIRVTGFDKLYVNGQLRYTFTCYASAHEYRLSSANDSAANLLLVAFAMGSTLCKFLAIVTKTIQCRPTHPSGQSTVYFTMESSNVTAMSLTPDTPHVQVRRVYNLQFEQGMFDAMRKLYSSPLLQGILAPKSINFDRNAPFTALSTLNCKLNVEQSNIVRHICHRFRCASANSNITLVEGPPGTGKSRLITSLLLELMSGVRRPRKIVVYGSNDATVDSICRRLMIIRETMKRNGTESRLFTMVRIGQMHRILPQIQSVSLEALSGNRRTLAEFHAEKTNIAKKMAAARSPDSVDYFTRRYHLLNNIIQRIVPVSDDQLIEMPLVHEYMLGIADIICIGVHDDTALLSRLIQTAEVCIVDDASLLSESGTLMLPLELSTRCLVLVGDSQQRPDSQCPSLFVRMLRECDRSATAHSAVFRLCRQYRMLADICSWPNTEFYDGGLVNAVDTSAIRCPLRPYTIYDLEFQRQYRYASSDQQDSNEIYFVAAMLRLLMSVVHETHTIGIIVPHHTYAQTLRSITHGNLVINTIDAFRGQQKDIIIVCGAHLPHITHDTLQWLSVALTRARLCMIVCGTFADLSANLLWNSLLTDARQRDRYRRINQLEYDHLLQLRFKKDLLKFN